MKYFFILLLLSSQSMAASLGEVLCMTYEYGSQKKTQFQFPMGPSHKKYEAKLNELSISMEVDRNISRHYILSTIKGGITTSQFLLDDAGDLHRTIFAGYGVVSCKIMP